MRDRIDLARLLCPPLRNVALAGRHQGRLLHDDRSVVDIEAGELIREVTKVLVAQAENADRLVVLDEFRSGDPAGKIEPDQQHQRTVRKSRDRVTSQVEKMYPIRRSAL